MPPASNSTPRAVWASMIPAMSFMNTGMKWMVDVNVNAYLYGTCSTFTTAFVMSFIFVT